MVVVIVEGVLVVAVMIKVLVVEGSEGIDCSSGGGCIGSSSKRIGG